MHISPRQTLAHEIFEWSSMWKPRKKGMQLVATSRLESHKFGVSCLSDESVTIGIVLACRLRNASYLLKASPNRVPPRLRLQLQRVE